MFSKSCFPIFIIPFIFSYIVCHNNSKNFLQFIPSLLISILSSVFGNIYLILHVILILCPKSQIVRCPYLGEIMILKAKNKFPLWGPRGNMTRKPGLRLKIMGSYSTYIQPHLTKHKSSRLPWIHVPTC